MADHYDGNVPPNERRNFVHKRILGAATGFLGGGFTGAIGGFAAGGRKRSQRNAGPTTTRRGKGSRSRRGSRARQSIGQTFQVTDVPGFRGALERAIPFGATGLQVSGAPLGVGVAVTGGCPSGFHPNKSSYFRSDGAGGAVRVMKGTMCVRNRRMNALNPKAATKAIARVGAGKRASQIFGRITIRAKSCKK